jgi:ectoine hydroxylase-related dioxygenase (phytanoyl-CoA dioxygenase family)
VGLRHLPASTGLDDVIRCLEEDGAVIIDRLFTGSILEMLKSDLAPHLAMHPPGTRTGNDDERDFHGARTIRFGGLAAKTDAFVDVLLHPLLLGAAEHLLSPLTGDIQCAGGQVMAIGPGENAQAIHRDRGAWAYLFRGGFSGLVAVSAMVAVTDFTEANGATRVVPGSHRGGSTDAEWVAYNNEAEQASMDAGSVLLYTSDVVHGGGANRTDAIRVGMHLFYSLGWIRSEEAHQVALTREDAIRMPERARQLLGFASHYQGDSGGGRLWTVDYDDFADSYRA